MQYKPHDYQCFATEFIKSHSQSAVLLGCGMGKTAITLTALNDLLFDSFDAHRILVVAPLRVARDVWKQEAEKWDHLNGLVFSAVIGTEAERINALRAKADVYVINRENIQWLVEESGFDFDYDTLVVDELSSFKNHQTKRFRALMMVRPKVKRIVGLTGTPSSNGLMDLWAEFRLLDMGERLGRYLTKYRLKYFEPDKRNAQMVFSYKPQKGAEEEIYKAVSDITISMKSVDFLKMPEKLVSEVEVSLSENEKQKYDSLKKEMVVSLSDSEITAGNAAVLAGKLIQLANGAIYTEEKETVAFHDRKLDALEDIIEGSNGCSVLVVYWFKHDRQRIEQRLKSLNINFRELDSSESIRLWNKGALQIGLVHPASAGHGLNLQEGGSHIVWFGLTWSLELYQQTNARLYRQGQKSETVVIQHIVAKDTIDRRILQVLKNKETVQDSLIDAVKAEIGGAR